MVLQDSTMLQQLRGSAAQSECIPNTGLFRSEDSEKLDWVLTFEPALFLKNKTNKTE